MRIPVQAPLALIRSETSDVLHGNNRVVNETLGGRARHLIALELADKKASPSECEKALEEKYYAGLMKVKDDIFGSGKVVAYAILYEKWLCDLRLLLTAKKVGKTI